MYSKWSEISLLMGVGLAMIKCGSKIIRITRINPWENKMKNKIRFATKVLSSVIAMQCAGATAATIEEVIVTTQKRAQSTQDIPMAVSAFGGDALRDMGARDTSSIIARTPGLGGAKDGDSQSIISIRGISTGAFAPGADNSVGTYYNEVPVSRNIGGQGLLDVESVEVVKGPQGTLFGRNTSSGAISITNAAANLDEDSLELRVAGGNEGQQEYELTGNKVLSNTLAIRFVGRHDERDGTGQDLDGEEVNNRDHDQYRVSLQWDVSDTVNVKLFHEKFDVDTNLQVYMDPAEMHTSSVSTSSAGKPKQTVDNDLTVANVTWDINDGLTLTSITGFFESEVSAVPNDLGPSALIGVPATANRFVTIFEEFWDIEQFSQDFRINGSNESVDWFVGASYYNEKVDVSGSLVVDAGLFLDDDYGTPAELADTGIRDAGDLANTSAASNETTSWAVYGDATFNVTELLAVTVGARYTDEEKEGSGVTTDDGLEVWLVGSGSSKDSWSSFDPRVAIDYQLDENVLLYASVAKGFKSGGVNRFFDANGNQTSFGPEENIAIELGVKADLLDGAARLNASVFQYDYSDFQLETAGAGGSLQIQSTADLKSTGFELDGTLLVGDHLDFRLAYAYIDAEFDKGIAGSPASSIKGNVAARAPEQNWSLLSTYSVDMDAGTVRVRAEYTYSDESYYTVFQDDVDPGYKTDSYGLVNVRLSFDSADEKWGVALVGSNVADKEYTSSILDLGIPLYVPGMGALWKVEGRYSF